MTKRDWMSVGVKVVGVYFGVQGVTVLSTMVVLLIITEMQRSRIIESGVDMVAGLQPIAYLVCAYVLTRRTEWCLRWLGFAAVET